jgi:hypothetical protein
VRNSNLCEVYQHRGAQGEIATATTISIMRTGNRNGPFLGYQSLSFAIGLPHSSLPFGQHPPLDEDSFTGNDPPTLVAKVVPQQQPPTKGNNNRKEETNVKSMALRSLLAPGIDEQTWIERYTELPTDGPPPWHSTDPSPSWGVWKRAVHLTAGAAACFPPAPTWSRNRSDAIAL